MSIGSKSDFLGERKQGGGKEDDSTITNPEKKTTDRNFSVVSENVLQIRIVLENGLWPSQPLLQSRGLHLKLSLDLFLCLAKLSVFCISHPKNTRHFSFEKYRFFLLKKRFKKMTLL